MAAFALLPRAGLLSYEVTLLQTDGERLVRAAQGGRAGLRGRHARGARDHSHSG